jgi:F420-non-reducing hydrogenase iron-sulfur subunit
MEGECHYLEGNTSAKRRVKYVAGLLDQIGLGSERVQMVNMSSAMAVQFAEAVEQMTEAIKALGPNPFRETGDEK